MSGNEPGLSERARSLLALGRAEQPGAEVHAHAAQAGLRALSSAGATASGAASWLASRAVIKLAAGASVVAVGVGLWRFALEHPEHPLPRPQLAQPRAEPAAARSPAVVHADEARVEPPLPSAPAAEAKPRSARVVAPASSPGARVSDELSREIGILDRAKARLTAGDSRGALRIVDEQRLQILGPEALALKIEALIMNGERVRARQLATQFLESHPASPLARRVSALQVSLEQP